MRKDYHICGAADREMWKRGNGPVVSVRLTWKTVLKSDTLTDRIPAQTCCIERQIVDPEE